MPKFNRFKRFANSARSPFRSCFPFSACEQEGNGPLDSRVMGMISDRKIVLIFEIRRLNYSAAFAITMQL